MPDDAQGGDTVESGRPPDDQDDTPDRLRPFLAHWWRLLVVGLLVVNAVATTGVWWELRSRHAVENDIRCIESVLTPRRETPLSDSQRELAELLDCDVPAQLLRPESGQ